MKRTAWFFFTACVLAQSAGGIRPRPSASDYPAHESIGGVTVAAAALSNDQVRKLFAADLNKGGYLVLEVAIYPENGKKVDLATGDFTLRIGAESEYLRAADSQAIASNLRQKNTPATRRASDVGVYPTASIGYESGTDPVTGRRVHGVYTEAGVGVASGGAGSSPYPPPGSTDLDQAMVERELAVKAVPEGKITQAVAGYLYFPRPSGKVRKGAYELNWNAETARLRVSVPPPAK